MHPQVKKANMKNLTKMREGFETNLAELRSRCDSGLSQLEDDLELRRKVREVFKIHYTHHAFARCLYYARVCQTNQTVVCYILRVDHYRNLLIYTMYS